MRGNFGWVWPRWAGRPRFNRIVKREVQYQFEVNRCRNEEIIVKGNFGCAWPMLAGRPMIDRIVIRKVQYQFEVNRCRNEEIIVKLQFWPKQNKRILQSACMWAGRPRVGNGAMHKVRYQFEDNRCRNEEIKEIVARTDRRMAEITTISPRFSKSVGIIMGF
ncbi:hypothetical protein DPMN_001971 [Dreissena polymorpha]|uniref:Uncharacterized protein n=1 Tax=Dreissena polymorpha TaxID=45954 RepID=A0A9D4MLC0_DREPO|nr:hypothetical protein DPMN_001971 [Dreissena polymorpha]